MLLGLIMFEIPAAVSTVTLSAVKCQMLTNCRLPWPEEGTAILWVSGILVNNGVITGGLWSDRLVGVFVGHDSPSF
jgi:hypothetical protein